MLGPCLTTTSSLFSLNSNIWDSEEEYRDDFKKIVFERENCRLPYHHKSPQLSYRAQLIDYLKKCASKMKLTHCCLHLAVYLLDIFMDNHSIVSDRLLLVANTCLLVAAKFEEISTAIPKILELNAAVKNAYPVKDYKALECVILKFYNWYIMFPTVAHYVSYFLRALVSEDEMKRVGSPRSLLYDMHLVIRLLMDKTLDDVHYTQQFSPSKLGAAIICATRKQVGLLGWSIQLQELTHYSQNDIKEELFALTQYGRITLDVALVPKCVTINFINMNFGFFVKKNNMFRLG